MNYLKFSTSILTLLLSFNLNANTLLIKNNILNNSASVTSVSEKFADEVKSKEYDYKKRYIKLLEKNCKQEIKIFCDNNLDNYSCLKNNYKLTTGKCNSVLKQEYGKGVYNGILSIHDLKLTTDTKLLESKKLVDYTISTYKTNNVFDYRGLRFRKGFIKVRNYKDSNYSGQFVVYSGKPKNIFKDNSGISYNPFLQKGPFFFDKKGNVKIGTLNKEIEYKMHIKLKKGSIVVFNNDRTLKKGTLSKAVRIGRCGFLSGMEITEEEIQKCLKK